MFFARYLEKKADLPVEVLHEAKPQRRCRSRKVRTTESIISEKVKKYLHKLFGESAKLRSVLEKSTSVEEEFYPKMRVREEVPAASITRVTFPEVFPKHPGKIKLKLRKHPQKNKTKMTHSSLNNLLLCSQLTITSEKEEEEEDEQKSSFSEMVDDLIKKQKKKHAKSKKLKKTTKSSISTICDRAKFLLNSTFLNEELSDVPIPEEPPRPTILLGSLKDPQDNSDEEALQEELLEIRDFNVEQPPQIERPHECYHPNIFRPPQKCVKKPSITRKLYHHSSLSLNYLSNRDFEADLEVWTTDYINGLVAVHDQIKPEKCSKIPVKKKSKSVKTKTRNNTNVKIIEPNGDVDAVATHAHLLGAVNTTAKTMGEDARKPPSISLKKPPKLKCKTDEYLCQKVQDIQNYINHLIPPAKPQHEPQKQSIQELKKFQRELKLRIKELERKLPAASASTKDSKHELSFLNLSKFLDGDNDKKKVINKVRYCTKKNSFNLKMRFGDKFCECCFLDARRFPNDICRRCNKKVYLVERICAGDGVYHKFCYSCYYCKRNLNSLNLCVTRGEIFCKQCFQKHFGPEMYGFIK